MDESLIPSGIVTPDVVSVESTFTERSIVSDTGFNLLIKARRYGRWWLLKTLKPEYRNQTVYQALLQKEFDITSSLQHPGIVTVFSLEEIDPFGTCIVMEWIDGNTLSTWLKDRPKLKERRRITFELIDTLCYVHKTNTEHRDLKPSNIMITHHGEHVKLIDFGLGDTSNYAILKQKAGTEGYIAPEGPSDIYAVGCLLNDIRVGWWARFVINKCKKPLTSRYSTLDEVKKDLHRSILFPRLVASLLLGLTIMVTILATGILYVKHDTGQQMSEVKNLLTDSLNVLKESNRQNAIAYSATNDSLQNRIKELETEKQAVAEHDIMLKETVEKGKNSIDEYVKKTGIAHYMDTLSNVKYINQQYYNFYTGIGMNDLINSYMKSISGSFNETEHTQIMMALHNYFFTHYGKKYNDKVQQLSRQ